MHAAVEFITAAAAPANQYPLLQTFARDMDYTNSNWLHADLIMRDLEHKVHLARALILTNLLHTPFNPNRQR